MKTGAKSKQRREKKARELVALVKKIQRDPVAMAQARMLVQQC